MICMETCWSGEYTGHHCSSHSSIFFSHSVLSPLETNCMEFQSITEWHCCQRLVAEQITVCSVAYTMYRIQTFGHVLFNTLCDNCLLTVRRDVGVVLCQTDTHSQYSPYNTAFVIMESIKLLASNIFYFIIAWLRVEIHNFPHMWKDSPRCTVIRPSTETAWRKNSSGEIKSMEL